MTEVRAYALQYPDGKVVTDRGRVAHFLTEEAAYDALQSALIFHGAVPVEVAILPASELDRLRADLAAEKARAERIQTLTAGWMYAYACDLADRGVDIRTMPVRVIVDLCRAELADALTDQPEQPT